GSNLEVLRTDGRLILLGLLGGRTHKEDLELGKVLRKRLRIQGTTLRSRTLAYKRDLVEAFWQFAEPRFKDERLNPVIHTIYPFEQIQSAHALMERNENVGKIVVLV
ncbi:MAG: zinc-binding dehydrogenase, partial [Bacteroidia bacterium]